MPAHLAGLQADSGSTSASLQSYSAHLTLSMWDEEFKTTCLIVEVETLPGCSERTKEQLSGAGDPSPLLTSCHVPPSLTVLQNLLYFYNFLQRFVKCGCSPKSTCNVFPHLEVSSY